MSGIVINGKDNRQYIRHPSDIPLGYSLVSPPSCYTDTLNNISLGGLCFQAEQFIEPEQWLELNFPIYDDPVTLEAKVRWCHPRDDHGFDIGVIFQNNDEAFTARMVEQVCHIEKYKKDVLEIHGRDLTGEQAASEWIEKFATEFPQT